MLDLITATGFDKCLPKETGKTRPFFARGTRAGEDEEIEIVIKLRAGCDLKEKAMLAEAMSAILAVDLGLPIPEPYLVNVVREYADSIEDAEAKDLAQASLGVNFGLAKLSVGFSLWTPGRPVPESLRETAAEILAFDLLIGNDDRRAGKPNCLFDGTDFAIIDHEMAFPQQVTGGVLFWQAPWEEGAFDRARVGEPVHLFQRSLAGKPLDFNRLQGAWEAIDEERLQAYLRALPSEWAALKEAQEILSYLGNLRDNLPAALREVTKLLA